MATKAYKLTLKATMDGLIEIALAHIYGVGVGLINLYGVLQITASVTLMKLLSKI